ncbi:hypothetical protein V7S43_013813 [Phytophthora oleae]|uniref:Membrane-associated protein n=1 Tax=Phytophthora oleae TaxID=2107226 RepID=A0ABD3F3W5_9STRA
MSASHRVAGSAKHNRPQATFSTPKMAILAVALLLAGVVVCDVTMETKILFRTSEFPARTNESEVSTDFNDLKVINESTCSPSTVNRSEIQYRSEHRYYATVEGMTPLPAPVFRDNHVTLCNKSDRSDLAFEYCLPISGRKDASFCAGADRMDLLTHHSKLTRCYASVLHMLLVEVYEELQVFGKHPIVVFGSLLGAVRNGSMIPFTEDTDIAYSGELNADDDLGRALVSKGYHFFFFDIWRVCVAPTHPLATLLYDPTLPITGNFAVPYLDLYATEKLNDTAWRMTGFDDTLPTNKVEPFSQVTINGLPFDTVHDPNYFLIEMYGDHYMSPKPRE